MRISACTDRLAEWNRNVGTTVDAARVIGFIQREKMGSRLETGSGWMDGWVGWLVGWNAGFGLSGCDYVAFLEGRVR